MFAKTHLRLALILFPPIHIWSKIQRLLEILLSAQEIQVFFFKPQVKYTVQVRNSALSLLSHFAFWPAGITLSKGGDAIQSPCKQRASPLLNRLLITSLSAALPYGLTSTGVMELSQKKPLQKRNNSCWANTTSSHFWVTKGIECHQHACGIVPDVSRRSANKQTGTYTSKRNFLAVMQHDILF